MWSLLFALVSGVRALTLGVDGALHYSNGTFFNAVDSDGSVKWTFGAIFPVVTYTEGLNGTIHIAVQSTRPSTEAKITYYALNSTDGSIQWHRASLETGPCPKGSDVRFLSSDSLVYLVCTGSSSIQIEAIDIAGALKWTQSFPQSGEVDIGPNGGVLVSVYVDRTLTALQPEDGVARWTLKLDSYFGWSLSKGDVYVAPKRQINNGTTFAMDLLRVNGEDGNIIWNVSYGFAQKDQQQEDMHPKPILGVNGEVYVYYHYEFFALNTYDFCAFDINGNALRSWSWPTYGPRGQGMQHSTQQLEDGTQEDIFVSNPSFENKDIMVYSGSTGHLLWNASIAPMYFVRGFGPDGTVFAEDYGTTSVAIRNGDEAWRANYFHAVLMAKDGTTYLQYHNNVVALDMNGMQKWTYPIMDPTVVSTLDAESSLVVV